MEPVSGLMAVILLPVAYALGSIPFGLVIAMPTLIFHNFFRSRVQSLIIEMEKISLRMVAILKR